MTNGPGRQRDLVPTLDALTAPLADQIVRSLMTALRAAESVRPAAHLQVALAGLFGGEVGLKLAKRPWKRRSRHPSTLPIVAC